MTQSSSSRTPFCSYMRDTKSIILLKFIPLTILFSWIYHVKKKMKNIKLRWKRLQRSQLSFSNHIFGWLWVCGKILLNLTRNAIHVKKVNFFEAFFDISFYHVFKKGMRINESSTILGLRFILVFGLFMKRRKMQAEQTLKGNSSSGLKKKTFAFWVDGIWYSLHFSINWFMIKIWSMVDLTFLNPACPDFDSNLNWL